MLATHGAVPWRQNEATVTGLDVAAAVLPIVKRALHGQDRNATDVHVPGGPLMAEQRATSATTRAEGIECIDLVDQGDARGRMASACFASATSWKYSLAASGRKMALRIWRGRRLPRMDAGGRRQTIKTPPDIAKLLLAEGIALADGFPVTGGSRIVPELPPAVEELMARGDEDAPTGTPESRGRYEPLFQPQRIGSATGLRRRRET